MKPIFQITIAVTGLFLTSCTVYLKDLIYGDPTKRPTKENYLEAKAEGFTDEEAKRRALLIGNDTEEIRELKARRNREDREDRKKDDNPFGTVLRWD